MMNVLRAIGAALGATVAGLHHAQAVTEDGVKCILSSEIEKITLAAHGDQEAIAEWVTDGAAKGRKHPRRDLAGIVGRALQRIVQQQVKRGIQFIIDTALSREPATSTEDIRAVETAKTGVDANWVEFTKNGEAPHNRSIKNVAAFLICFGITLWFDEFSLESKVSGLAGHPDGARIDDGALKEMWTAKRRWVQNAAGDVR